MIKNQLILLNDKSLEWKSIASARVESNGVSGDVNDIHKKENRIDVMTQDNYDLNYVYFRWQSA